jgi:hypothetical protein
LECVHQDDRSTLRDPVVTGRAGRTCRGRRCDGRGEREARSVTLLESFVEVLVQLLIYAGGLT